MRDFLSFSERRRLSRLKSVLSRRLDINTLECVSKAILTKPRTPSGIGSVAIAFDANVILRIPNHRDAAVVVDFLGQRFNGPLIVPQQALQEFWNNTLPVIETVGKKLKKRFGELKSDAEGLGAEFKEFSERIDEFVRELDENFGYAYDERLRHRIEGFLEVLSKRALLPTVDRMEFLEIAEMRQKTRTPPGFKDPGHGDFFVWLEMLIGAMESLEQGQPFEELILVTNDSKEDWVRDNVPHPILSAEVAALLGKPFVIWQLDDFAKAVKKEVE